MYTTFYGLSRPPFELTPDPEFYFQTPFHNEGLANLCYGVQQRKGFIVLTGEVGTGKTLLVNRLMNWLAGKEIRFSHISAPRLTSLEFLQYVLTDLGIPSVFSLSKAQLLLQLNAFLIGVHRMGSTTVLIVDEAHLLDWDVLEELRLLTNLETASHKLLQIILTGQPELDLKLDSRDLRQLKQRIALRCRLKPLTREQTADYITERLRHAGAKWKIFPDPTVARIHEYAQGIPRLINTVCDSALISGCAQQLRFIPPECVDETAEDFRLHCGPLDDARDASSSTIHPVPGDLQKFRNTAS
jgi:general secretion pathway protein A